MTRTAAYWAAAAEQTEASVAETIERETVTYRAVRTSPAAKAEFMAIVRTLSEWREVLSTPLPTARMSRKNFEHVLAHGAGSAAEILACEQQNPRFSRRDLA